MSEQGRFLIYCTEAYRAAKNLSGKQVAALFAEYGVSRYIVEHFDALHTTGEAYIVGDIDAFIAARSN